MSIIFEQKLKKCCTFNQKLYKKLENNLHFYIYQNNSTLYNKIHNKLTNYIGGALKTFKFEEMHQFQYNVFEEENMIVLNVVSNDKNKNCMVLQIDGGVGNLQSINNFNDCLLGDTKKIGTYLLKGLIKLLKTKLSHRYKIQKIQLSDNSLFKCKNIRTIDIKYSHTLTNGTPWYYDFGFRFENTDNNDRVKKNIEIANTKVKKRLKEKDLKKIENLTKQEYVYVLSLYKKYEDTKIKYLFKELIKHCDLFGKIYMKLYELIGFRRFTSKIMFINL